MSTTYSNVGTVLVFLTFKWKGCMVLFICLENHILVGGMSGNFVLKILNEPCIKYKETDPNFHGEVMQHLSTCSRIRTTRRQPAERHHLTLYNS